MKLFARSLGLKILSVSIERHAVPDDSDRMSAAITRAQGLRIGLGAARPVRIINLKAHYEY